MEHICLLIDEAKTANEAIDCFVSILAEERRFTLEQWLSLENLLKELNCGSHSTQEATYREVIAVITEQDQARHARNLQKLTKIQVLLQAETEQALSCKTLRRAPNLR